MRPEGRIGREDSSEDERQEQPGQHEKVGEAAKAGEGDSRPEDAQRGGEGSDHRPGKAEVRAGVSVEVKRQERVPRLLEEHRGERIDVVLVHRVLQDLRAPDHHGVPATDERAQAADHESRHRAESGEGAGEEQPPPRDLRAKGRPVQEGARGQDGQDDHRAHPARVVRQERHSHREAARGPVEGPARAEGADQVGERQAEEERRGRPEQDAAEVDVGVARGEEDGRDQGDAPREGLARQDVEHGQGESPRQHGQHDEAEMVPPEETEPEGLQLVAREKVLRRREPEPARIVAVHHAERLDSHERHVVVDVVGQLRDAVETEKEARERQGEEHGTFPRRPSGRVRRERVEVP